jgi:hypothetical protein
MLDRIVSLRSVQMILECNSENNINVYHSAMIKRNLRTNIIHSHNIHRAVIVHGFDPNGSVDDERDEWFINIIGMAFSLFVGGKNTRIVTDHLAQTIWFNYSKRFRCARLLRNNNYCDRKREKPTDRDNIVHVRGIPVQRKQYKSLLLQSFTSIMIMVLHCSTRDDYYQRRWRAYGFVTLYHIYTSYVFVLRLSLFNKRLFWNGKWI